MNATTFEHHAGGEPFKFVDSPGRSLKLYGGLYGLSVSSIVIECPAKLPIEPRYTFGPYDFQK
jgi:hypothetical protein